MEPLPIYNQNFSFDYHNFVLQDNMLNVNPNMEMPKRFVQKSEKSNKTKKEMAKEKQKSKTKPRPFT